MPEQHRQPGQHLDASGSCVSDSRIGCDALLWIALILIAISGVLAGYLVLFPKNRVKVLIGMRFVQEVPALVMIGMWALFQFIAGAASITASAQTSGVAYMAHIGGFIAGLVLAFLLRGFADRGTPARISS